MKLLTHLVVVLHLLGLAAVIGSAVFVSRGVPTSALVWGARAQLVTGLLLVGLNEAGDDPVDHTKVAVKLLVGIAVVACAEVAAGRARRGRAKPALVHAAGALAVLNTVVAVLWT